MTYWGASTGTSNEELLLHDLLRVGPMRCLPWHVSAQPLLQPHVPVDLLSEEEVTTPHQAPLSPRQPDAPCKSTSSKSMVDRMFPSPAVRCLGPSFNLPLVSRYMPAPGSGGGGMDPALPAGAWPAPPARTAPAKLLDSGVWLVRDPSHIPTPPRASQMGGRYVSLRKEARAMAEMQSELEGSTSSGPGVLTAGQPTTVFRLPARSGSHSQSWHRHPSLVPCSPFPDSPATLLVEGGGRKRPRPGETPEALRDTAQTPTPGPPPATWLQPVALSRTAQAAGSRPRLPGSGQGPRSAADASKARQLRFSLR